MSEKDEITEYVEAQVGEHVIHLEHAASELVGLTRHDIWDVHCTDSRWWVVTNPTHFYSQTDFKSRDVVLTFHIGLMIRVMQNQERRVPVRPDNAVLIPGTWRRWQQAFEPYETGDEAENFQAVGVRLRECLLSFVGETCSDELMPEDETPPKAGDFIHWTELLANHLAAGKSSAALRSYLKNLASETWHYVNWLTHAKNANRLDAEIGLKAVEHVLGTFTAARMRLDRAASRCADCGSYRVIAGTCEQCGWIDQSYQPVEFEPLTEEELERRLAEPCTPTSDISTFMSPEDVT